MRKAVEIIIARATPDDVLGIQDVTYRGWLATYPNAEHGITVDDIEDWYRDRHTEERIAQWRERMANPPDGETTLIAKEGGKIVGALRAIKHADRNQIYAIYVLPEHHGRGIGTAMWQKAQHYLDSNKHSIVEVAIYNTKAIMFYGRLGFTDTGKRMSNPRFKMKSGAVIPEMEMRREAETTSL
jgi:ribosomal protein S18 acetylase RimI-like enzyme